MSMYDGDLADLQITVTHGADERGSHWRSMPPPADALRDKLGQMRAAVRLANGEPGPGDLACLDLDDRRETDVDLNDAEQAQEWADRWPLAVAVARWDDDSSSPARVVVVLGTGGPGVELDISCDRQGYPESVALEQRWSGVRRAVTTDPRALGILDAFLSVSNYAIS